MFSKTLCKTRIVKEQQIEILVCSAQSSDLFPIGDLWEAVEKKIQAKKLKIIILTNRHLAT